MVILMSFEAEETAAWLQIAQMFFHGNLTNAQFNAKQYKTVCNSMQNRKAISQTCNPMQSNTKLYAIQCKKEKQSHKPDSQCQVLGKAIQYHKSGIQSSSVPKVI